MLAVARALVTNPRLLILDEATEGLAPIVRDEIWKTIRLIRGTGMATLIVDKTVAAVTAVSDRIVVLVKGETVFEGTPAELTADPAFMHRHLACETHAQTSLTPGRPARLAALGPFAPPSAAHTMLVGLHGDPPPAGRELAVAAGSDFSLGLGRGCARGVGWTAKAARAAPLRRRRLPPHCCGARRRRGQTWRSAATHSCHA